MSKNVMHLYHFSSAMDMPALKATRPPGTPESLADLDDAMDADVTLGIAAQVLCNTRDELIGYARDAQLLPYLCHFVERRGWLDDDWLKRIAAASNNTPVN